MTPADILARLAEHLWQSTLVAAAAGLATLALRRNHARVRHWLWLAASVKFLVPFALLIALGTLAGHILDWRTAAVPPQLTIVMEDAGPLAAPPVHRPAPANSAPPKAAPAFPASLPNLLLAVWLSGAAAMLIRWRIRWRPIAAALRRAQPVAAGRELDALHRLGGLPNVRLAVSDAAIEPGVCGLLRPILLLPAGIAGRLSDAQLESVLAHELCHIRRRDNLAAALHMLVEALFWFHPLVWWLGARLVEERERACDEEVVLRGSDPETYAEGILQVCRFCLQPPVPCVSGITGADLSSRIASIVSAPASRNLNFGRRLLLAALAIAAAGGPLAIGLLDAPRGRAQSRDAAPAAFDVASVKLLGESNSLPPGFSTLPVRSGGRIHWITRLPSLVRYAYHLQSWRMTGLHANDSVEAFYAIDATAPESTTDDRLRLMFQTLLAERFKLAAHRETRELNGYALLTGKNGPKIRAAKPGDEPAPVPEYFRGKPDFKTAFEGKTLLTVEYGRRVLTGRRVSMLQLAEALQEPLSAFVLDDTGLPGNFYFALEFVPEDNPHDVDGPGLFAALQEQLGLKLEKRKGPVAMLVVDHIEKVPSEN